MVSNVATPMPGTSNGRSLATGATMCCTSLIAFYSTNSRTVRGIRSRIPPTTVVVI